MEIMVSRNQNRHEGISVYSNERGTTKQAFIINGNKPDYDGPVVLTEIDQYVLFGLMHPDVITRIIDRGPQVLITTKELGHKIFEHGMKSCIGSIKIKNNFYQTSLSTFYQVVQQHGDVSISPDSVPSVTYKNILLHHRCRDDRVDRYAHDVDLSELKTVVTRQV